MIFQVYTKVGVWGIARRSELFNLCRVLVTVLRYFFDIALWRSMTEKQLALNRMAHGFIGALHLLRVRSNKHPKLSFIWITGYC